MTAPTATGVRAVVFDLDGTLVDSMPLVLRAYAHALAPFLPPMRDHELFLLLGAPPERTFSSLLADESQVATAMRRLIAFSTENWRLIQPFSGMTELLADLRSHSLRLAVWTGRDRKSAEWIFREQTLLSWIETVVCGDDFPTHKPDPSGLSEILNRFGTGTDEVIFVGDADVDVLAGAALGVRTILIRHGRPIQETVSSRAWRVVESPQEAYAVVRAALRSVV
ncbi:MAG: HAD-IA family hydrolase [Opitutaceae bacterium]